MQRMQIRYSFYFYDHFSFNPKVQTISGIQLHIAVYQRQGNLLFYIEAHVK